MRVGLMVSGYGNSHTPMQLGDWIALAGTRKAEGDPLEYRIGHGSAYAVGDRPQETLLLHDTLEANLRYGSWATTAEVVARAVRVAGLTGLLGADRKDAMIGDRGMQLSGGERQRLAIARALLRDADVLVLDEATSALDVDSERQVIGAVRREYAGTTLIVVSHRASALEQMDEIACLSGGRVVEQGSHDELLARRGAYWRLLHCAESQEAVAA